MMSMLKKLLNSLKKISFIHLCDSLNLNKQVLFTCLMVTLFSGLSIVHIYMNGALVDRLIGGIDDSLPFFAGLYIGVALFICLFRMINNVIIEKGNRSVQNGVKNTLLKIALKGDYQCVNSRLSNGELIHSFEKDSRNIYQILNGRFIPSIQMILMAFVSFIAMCVLNIIVGIAFLAITVVAGFLMQRVYTDAGAIQKEALNSEAAATSIASEMFAGIQTVKAFQTEEYMYGKYCERIDDATEKSLMVEKKNFKSMILSTFCTSIPFFAMALCCVALIRLQYISIGQALVLLTLGNAIQSPIMSMGSIMRGMNILNAASQRLNAMIAVPLEHNGEKKSLLQSAEVVFDNVSFGYEGRNSSIANLSFTAGNNAKIWIQGASGAGKTTILRLIQGLVFPDKGSVRINGVNTREWNLEVLRENVSVIQQDPVMIHDSIYNNIRLAKADASEQEIMLAAQRAGVMQFASKMPEGIHTQISHTKLQMSGGEKQRIAIAQVLLRNSSVVLLDECTSWLDRDIAETILQELNELFKEKLVIFVSHQDIAPFHYDRKYVLSDAGLELME